MKSRLASFSVLLLLLPVKEDSFLICQWNVMIFIALCSEAQIRESILKLYVNCKVLLNGRDFGAQNFPRVPT